MDPNPSSEVFGIENLMRPGGEMNRRLHQVGIRVFHDDICSASDVEASPVAGWVTVNGRTETFR
jgi:hypothetical protein